MEAKVLLRDSDGFDKILERSELERVKIQAAADLFDELIVFL